MTCILVAGASKWPGGPLVLIKNQLKYFGESLAQRKDLMKDWNILCQNTLHDKYVIVFGDHATFISLCISKRYDCANVQKFL